jgi:hypothetical protein
VFSSQPRKVVFVDRARLSLLDRGNGRSRRESRDTSAISPKLSPGPRIAIVVRSPSGVMILIAKRPLAIKWSESPGSSR